MLLSEFVQTPRQEGFYWVKLRDLPLCDGWFPVLYTSSWAFDPDHHNLINCDPLFVHGERTYGTTPGSRVVEIGAYIGWGPGFDLQCGESGRVLLELPL